MDEPLIRYKNVNINQQELGVLEDVNLELNKGEFVYLIGKVGSGKTSLLKPSTANWISNRVMLKYWVTI